MCGIAGILDPAGATDGGELARVADAMAGTLTHRGPDDAGCWTDPAVGVALSHRRLEVVGRGPQGGQPMRSPSGRWVLTYNGELYNAPSLRAQLEGSGAVFRGTSDTEVLVVGIDRWGLEETLERIEGMFAFGAWDAASRCLHLARDRFGEKPLFYGWTGGRFAFASELKAFHAIPRFDPDIDRDAVAQFLRLSSVPAPQCIYRGLAKLVPGSRVALDAAARPGILPAQIPYWSAPAAIDAALALPVLVDDREATDRVEEALSEAVAARMVADVPIGALLSGGVDSSVVVALMQRHSPRPVRTFTVAFADQSFDESVSAEAVAAHLGTDHTTVEMPPSEVFDIVPRVADIWDEPFSDSSQLPTHLVSKVARRSVTVALSGDGGDELFAGYNRHAWLDRVWRTAKPLPSPVRRTVGRSLRALPPGAIDSAASVLPSRWQVRLPSTKVAKLGRVLEAPSVRDAYGALIAHWEDPASVVLGVPPLVDGRVPDIGGEDVMSQLLRADLTTYLPDDVLTKVDRASMAVSLETRAPFLDRGVLDVAWRLPGSSKLRDGVSKWMLRQVLYRHVPRALVDRPKMGFGIPISTWLRGPLRPWAEDLLAAPALARHGVLDPGPVREAWRLHLSKRRDLGYELWDVLMLEAWLDRWKSPAAP
jgi:asparagine synthase (glutamine-hydrolysing)